MLNLMVATNEHTEQYETLEKLPELLGSSNSLFWLDLEAPTQEEAAALEELFRFHPLTVEEALANEQRASVQEFEGYVFFGVDTISFDTNAWREPYLHPTEKQPEMIVVNRFYVYLSSRYLVTVHQDPIPCISSTREVCVHTRRAVARGTDYLLYTLLDILVDGYFPMLDMLEDHIDALEDQIISRPRRRTLEAVLDMKHNMMRMRKHISPVREVVQALTTRHFPGVRTKTLPYFREVADHVFRVYESLDTYRDQLSNLLDAYLSQVNNNMSRVMQRLTAVSIMFLPMTFLTGFFGMNFENMPWAKTNPIIWFGVMVLVAIATLFFFNKRDWI